MFARANPIRATAVVLEAERVESGSGEGNNRNRGLLRRVGAATGVAVMMASAF